MSKGAALQDGIHAALLAHTALTDVVGGRVYDNPPSDVAYPYITFGPDDAVFADAEGMDVDEISFQIDVWTQDEGAKRSARLICGLVGAALGAGVILSEPFLLQHLHVDRVRVMADLQDDVAHGIVTVSARVADQD